ncbi:M20 family metallopeptidase [Streptomyces sp. NPDC098085]|uniref:M20 family metallopeptidase n=1 Tax=Streptomyces sp. NPDC098085 TaxID=3366094 RepID=UPI0037FF3676
MTTPRGEMLDTLTAAVQIPSITPTYPGEVYADLVGAEGEVSRLLAEVYAEAGAETDIFAVEPGRDNAVGVIHGTGGGRSLIFNGHVDVVPPGGASGWRSGDPFDGVVEDGWIRGRGTVDMKSGLVAQAFAARALHEAGVSLRGDLILQAVVGEENLENHLGTSAVLDRGYTADGAIVSEPTGGAWPLSVMAATPGLLVMRIEVAGKSSHSSMRGRMLCRPSTTEAVAASAIDRGFVIYQALRRLESDWAVTKFDPLFEPGHFTLAQWGVHPRLDEHGVRGVPPAGGGPGGRAQGDRGPHRARRRHRSLAARASAGGGMAVAVSGFAGRRDPSALRRGHRRP